MQRAAERVLVLCDDEQLLATYVSSYSYMCVRILHTPYYYIRVLVLCDDEQMCSEVDSLFALHSQAPVHSQHSQHAPGYLQRCWAGNESSTAANESSTAAEATPPAVTVRAMRAVQLRELVSLASGDVVVYRLRVLTAP
jgi:hypothetical protein